MGTRSYITRKIGKYKFEVIYCHWDGYPEHNGRILLEHYQNEDKIDQLFELGDLSSLGAEIGEKHDYNEHSR